MEGTRWLRAVGDTLGSTAARAVAYARGTPIGDTATVHFYSSTKEIARATAVLADTAGEKGPGQPAGALITFTYTMISVP